jgi:hypothetical protein
MLAIASYKHLPKSANTSHDSLISASPTLNSDRSKRGLLLMGYIVFYQVVEDDIEILRVERGYAIYRRFFKMTKGDRAR